ARAYLFDVSKEGAIEKRSVEMDIFVDCLGVHIVGHIVALQERLDLAGENDAVPVVVKIELLHAQRVSSEDEPLVPGVPERQAEDTRDIGEDARTVNRQQLQERFGVGRTAEFDSAPGEATAKTMVVVELAVVRQTRRAV